ncbi:MAG: VanW family protein, partial [Ignavibacteriales bacterium]
ASQSLVGETFPRGTYVAGIDLGGVSQAKAVRLLEQKMGPFAEREYTFTCLKASHKIKAADIGARADFNGFLKNIMDRENQRPFWKRIFNFKQRSYQLKVKVTYDRSQYSKGITRVCMALDKPARASRVRWDASGNPSVIPGVDGERIDQEATFKILPRVYRGEKGLGVHAKTRIESLSIDMDTLNRQTPIASFSTGFDPGNVNRTYNLRLAASALDGVIIPAGREFSYNAAVGPRDFSTGYKEAMIIVKNEFTPGVGGGICQVSSTLYNAALLANLPITERHNHSLVVPYLAPGLDATVSSRMDLRFKNNTAGPLCIRVSASGSKLNISLLGESRNPVRVKIEPVVSKTIPFVEIRKPDPELAMGKTRVDHNGANGYHVKCYRLVYDTNGNLLSRKLLSSDVYKPLGKLVLVGTKVDPTSVTPTDIPVETIEPAPVNPVDPTGQDSGLDMPAVTFPEEQPMETIDEPFPTPTNDIGG